MLEATGFGFSSGNCANQAARRWALFEGLRQTVALRDIAEQNRQPAWTRIHVGLQDPVGHRRGNLEMQDLAGVHGELEALVGGPAHQGWKRIEEPPA